MQNTSLTVDEIRGSSIPFHSGIDFATIPAGAGIPSGKEEFFSSLVEQLARSLDADCSWIAEFDPGPHADLKPGLRTLAVYSDGEAGENLYYSVSDTPAQIALTKSGVCVYPSGVQELFPHDGLLRRANASSYVGIPLLNSANEPIGLLAAVSRNPRPDTRFAASVLRVLASRAVVELERIKAADSLRASEARLRLIFESTPDAHLLLTLDGKLIEANRTAEDLLGYRREDMIGRNVLLPGILPEEDLRRAATQLARRAAGSPTTHQEYTIIRGDGSRVVVETLSQLAAIDGVRMMLLCMRDITARKAAQQERQDRLERVQELQAAAFGLATHELIAKGDLNQIAALITETVCRVARVSAAGVWLFAAEGEIRCLDRFDSANARHSSEKRIKSKAVESHRFVLEQARIIATTDDVRNEMKAANAIPSVDCGIRIRGNIKGLLRIECAGTPFSEKQEESQFVTAVADLFAQVLIYADRAAVEDSLRKSEARLSRIQRLAALGSWERDLTTDAMTWSDEVLRIYGISKDDFVPTRQFFLDRVFPADLGKIDAAVNELLLSRDTCQISFRVVRPDGSLRHVRELLELESNALGKPVRLIGSVQDVTDFKQMEDQFQAAQRIESFGRLASGIAQAFNNLLMVVNGHSSLIARSPSSQAVVKNGMETIRKAGEDASHLVRQFLAFTQNQATEVVAIDLNTIVREFDCMLRSLFGADIEIVSLLEPEPGKAEASPAQLNQLVLSLVMNARDAMPRGGRITMQTSNLEPGDDPQSRKSNPGAGAWVALSITDTGDGVDETACGRLSESFSTRRQESEGQGPEMATARALVQQLGGKIHVETRAGSGATVTVFLPRVCEGGVYEKDPLAEERIRGNETILVVDDQPEVRTLACSVLESLGYRVLSAPNADSAIQLSSDYPASIHLLLTDVVMPGMPGSELADRLRGLRASIKVLFMSGYTTNDAIRRNDAARGTAFIRKPFDPFVLAAKIRELLGTVAAAATILVADGNRGSRGMLHRVLSSTGFRILEASKPSEIDAYLHGGAVDLLVAGYSADGPFCCDGDLMQIKRTFPGLEVILIAPEGQSVSAASGVNVVLERPLQPDALISAVRKSLTHKIQLETENITHD